MKKTYLSLDRSSKNHRCVFLSTNVLAIKWHSTLNDAGVNRQMGNGLEMAASSPPRSPPLLPAQLQGRGQWGFPQG